MATVSADGFSSGHPHGWMRRWCSYLERIWIGEFANAILDRDQLLSTPAALVAMPMWWWGEPRMKVGRKGISRSGGPLHLPVRYTWDPAPLLLLEPGSSISVGWSRAGMGYDVKGRMSVVFDDGAPTQIRPSESRVLVNQQGDPPSEILAIPMTSAAIRATLQSMSEDAKKARWDAIKMLEPMLQLNVSRAHSYISQDVLGERGELLDKTTLDTLHDRLLLGDPSQEKSFSIIRLVDQCSMRPNQFLRVDPLKWVTMTIRREAQQAIRRAVGDPHVGSKVRLVASEMKTADPEAVIAEYRRRYPQDSLAQRRTAAALDVRPSPFVGAVPLDFQEGGVA